VSHRQPQKQSLELRMTRQSLELRMTKQSLERRMTKQSLERRLTKATPSADTWTELRSWLVYPVEARRSIAAAAWPHLAEPPPR
jgi:hypothetical protein